MADLIAPGTTTSLKPATHILVPVSDIQYIIMYITRGTLEDIEWILDILDIPRYLDSKDKKYNTNNQIMITLSCYNVIIII